MKLTWQNDDKRSSEKLPAIIKNRLVLKNPLISLWKLPPDDCVCVCVCVCALAQRELAQLNVSATNSHSDGGKAAQSVCSLIEWLLALLAGYLCVFITHTDTQTHAARE